MRTDSTAVHQSISPQPKPWMLPASGLTLFYGCIEMPRLSHYFLPRALKNGKNIVYLDGANRFDALLIARFARQQECEPSAFNNRLRCARAFTCFQLTELLVRVPRLLQSFPADVLLVTALPDLYFDEDVQDDDAIASFRGTLLNLKRLTRLLPVAVFSGATSSLMPRRKFLPQIALQADCVWRFSVKEDDRLSFVIEKPEPARLAS